MIKRKIGILVLLVLLFFGVVYAGTQSVTVVENIEKIMYDDDKTANNKEYFGWAKTGSATSAAVWKMMRITYTGNDYTIEYADGNQLYDNIWDNRTSLTYK